MDGIKKLWSGAILLGTATALVLLPGRAASRSPEGMSMPQSAPAEPVPAYHDQVPPAALPATMNPEFFTDPFVQNAYTVAARIKKTLYQQPCYCHCDRRERPPRRSAQASSGVIGSL